jgi:hypothetical protein
MMQQLGFRSKLLVATVGFSVLLGTGVFWYISRVTRAQAVEAARQQARRLTTQIGEVRDYYTRTVATVARDRNLTVTHDYAHQPGAIPLPATLVHEINDSLNRKEGYTTRLYSQYPFPPHRQNSPEGEFWRQEDYQGRRSSASPRPTSCRRGPASLATTATRTARRKTGSSGTSGAWWR